MKRFDLRHLGVSFEGRMCEIIEQNLAQGEVGIFIFEIGDFSSVQKSANLVAQKGWTLMNSLRFNEVDWTIVVKKATLDSATCCHSELSHSESEESKKTNKIVDSAPTAHNDKIEGTSNA